MLNQEELQQIIEKFDESNLKKNALFGIFQTSEFGDEYFIKANEEGLLVFVLQLLKSTQTSIKQKDNLHQELLHLDVTEDWIDENSTVIIEYIEFNSKEQADLTFNTPIKESFKDQLLPYGCLLIVISLFILVIIGLSTVFDWIF